MQFTIHKTCAKGNFTVRIKACDGGIVSIHSPHYLQLFFYPLIQNKFSSHTSDRNGQFGLVSNSVYPVLCCIRGSFNQSVQISFINLPKTPFGILPANVKLFSSSFIASIVLTTDSSESFSRMLREIIILNPEVQMQIRQDTFY